MDFIYLFSHKKIVYLLLYQVTTLILASLLISVAIQSSHNAPLAALIESMYPLFTLIFLYVFFHRNHFDWRFFAGGILILSGLLLIQLN